MALAEGLLPEFDQEVQITRRILERVPEDKLDWQPHPKSMKLGRLAVHLTELPMWGTSVMEADEFDIMPGGKPAYVSKELKKRSEILKEFDTNAAAARAAIAKASDAQFMRPWSLKSSGTAIFTMPKIAVLRGMVLNHMVHHRAQLGVFLRLNDVELPSTYGPSADDNPS